MSLVQAQSSAALKSKMGKSILGIWAVTKILYSTLDFWLDQAWTLDLGLDIELVN